MVVTLMVKNFDKIVNTFLWSKIKIKAKGLIDHYNLQKHTRINGKNIGETALQTNTDHNSQKLKSAKLKYITIK